MNIPTKTKGRGRPKGSVLAADTPRLDKMADYMLANPDADVVKAVHAALPKATKTDEHRLRRKFRADHDALLAAAKARADSKAPSRSIGGNGWSGKGLFEFPLDPVVTADRLTSAIREDRVTPANGGISHFLQMERQRQMAEKLSGSATIDRIMGAVEWREAMLDKAHGGRSMRKLIERHEKVLRAYDAIRRFQ